MLCLAVKSSYKCFKICTKDFHMIFLYHTLFLFIYLQYFRKNFNKYSKIEHAQIYLFRPTDLYLSNLRRSSNNSKLLNMKTRSILLEFWVKIVFSNRKFATIEFYPFQNSIINLAGLVCHASCDHSELFQKVELRAWKLFENCGKVP